MHLRNLLRSGATTLANVNPSSQTIRLILAALAVGLYALTFVELYTLYQAESLYLAAALVLILAWLLGFWAGIAAAVLSFPLNAILLEQLGEAGWTIVTRPGSLQAAVLVLVLGAVLGGLRDIGERLEFETATRQRAEQAQQRVEERYRIVVEGASEAIFTIDNERRILYANPAAESIFGYRLGDLQGQVFDLLLDEQHNREAGHVFLPENGALTTSERRAIQIWGRHRDGRPIPLEVSFGEHQAEGERSFIGIVRDITERRAAEQALKQAKEAAEQANTAKSDFLSRMSHELRTPLNAILGFGQLMEMDELADEQRESVEQILKAGRHLLELINEVLDIARIEAGRLALSLEPTPLAEVVQESCELVRPIAGQRSISMTCAPLADDAHVMADRQRLKQVMLNLLSNAVKYNREGGAVTIDSAVQGDRFLIRVTDTGLGIPAEKLSHLFTPFERLDADRTGIEGTGLGLALSKRLVEAMGGQLAVESEVGTGSSFAVELALASDPLHALHAADVTAEATPTASGTDPAGAGQRTILYIEDNISNFKLIQRVLSYRPGVGLLAAMQGQLGLELAAEHYPDLILLDLHLPDMHGSEVLRALKEDPRLKSIPVVVVSADATPGQIQRLLEAGARDYLTKPLNVQQFLRVLDDTLLEQGRVTNA